MTIHCDNCGHEELEGALFCSVCGHKLVQDGLSTAQISTTGIKLAETRPLTSPLPAPPPVVDADVSLHIVRTGQILPLVGRNEFTIGRVSEGQSVMPDIDLTPYEAYAQGVSRLHAAIRLAEGKVTILDLGSSNGTRVNNEKIAPHKEHAIKHGDVIALGQFKIQALVRQDN